MNEPNEDARERLSKIVQDHVSQLREHFDAVQILCSNLEEGGENTSSFAYGSGNWHARQGLAKEWTIYHDAKVLAKAINEDD